MNPNIAARLARQAAAHPDRLAIVDHGSGKRRAATYRQLADRVAATAAGLATRGVTRGDRVLLFVPMSLDLYVALLAVLHLGAEAVFVDAWAGRDRVDGAIAAAKPRAWIGSLRAQWLRVGSRAVRRIPIAVIVGGPWPLRRLERPEQAVATADVLPETTALVTFTTGSTGQPKAAPRSHALLWAQHVALSAHLQLASDDVDMPSLPVFVLNNLALGITSVLPDADPRRPSAIDPGVVLANMRDEGVTSLVASPAFCARLVDHVLQRNERLPLKRLFTGGAPVLPPLLRALAQAMPQGAEVIYGSTEAEPIAGLEVGQMLALQATDRGQHPIGLCVGAPVQQITLRIMRPHDGPVSFASDEWPKWILPDGETGEIVVAGDHVQPGYLDDHAANRENKIDDGFRLWHRTGDAGYLDTNGRLWLMGRVSRRVVRDGTRWWPLPAELRAFSVPGVSHTAYVSIPPAGEAILCVEAPSLSDRASAEQGLRDAVHPWPVDSVVFMDHIPRDPRHESKTDHAQLLAQLLAHLRNQTPS